MTVVRMMIDRRDTANTAIRAELLHSLQMHLFSLFSENEVGCLRDVAEPEMNIAEMLTTKTATVP